jgi:hypothetical protein
MQAMEQNPFLKNSSLEIYEPPAYRQKEPTKAFTKEVLSRDPVPLNPSV